ncbi:MAG: SURF1 family protein [Acidimicrobiales bacterium]
MKRFPLSPKWILAHLAVLATLGLFVTLGMWQLGRLDQRKQTNDLVRTRADAPALSLANALDLGRGEDLRFLRVELDGEYLDQTIFIDNRSYEGAPGSWLATPFVTNGLTILVVRGFVGRATTLNSDPSSLSPADSIGSLEGLLQPSASGGGFAIGREGLPAISRPNTNLIATELDIDLVDAYLQLESPIEDFIAPVSRPSLDNGPHLGYSLQWFVFALLTPIGYWLILRKATSVSVGKERVQ